MHEDYLRLRADQSIWQDYLEAVALFDGSSREVPLSEAPDTQPLGLDHMFYSHTSKLSPPVQDEGMGRHEIRPGPATCI